MDVNHAKYLEMVDPVLFLEPTLRQTLAAARQTVTNALNEGWVLWGNATGQYPRANATYQSWSSATVAVREAESQVTKICALHHEQKDNHDALYGLRDQLEVAFATLEAAQATLDQACLTCAAEVRSLLNPLNRTVPRSTAVGKSAVEVCRAVILLAKRVQVVKSTASLAL